MKKFIFILALILLSSCTQRPEDEISRLSSPDGIVDVVVTTLDEGAALGATVQAPTYVYIVPKNGNITHQNRILTADEFQIKSISWAGSQKLIISFYSGNVHSFTNNWHSADINSYGYKVRIYLNDTNQPE